MWLNDYWKTLDLANKKKDQEIRHTEILKPTCCQIYGSILLQVKSPSSYRHQGSKHLWGSFFSRQVMDLGEYWRMNILCCHIANICWTITFLIKRIFTIESNSALFCVLTLGSSNSKMAQGIFMWWVYSPPTLSWQKCLWRLF